MSENSKPIILAWWSAGITSAVAIKQAIMQYGNTHEIQIHYFKIDSAHPDNERFKSDCESWYGQKIIEHQGYFKDQFHVIQENRMVNSPYGAECTLQLKKNIRKQIEKSSEFDAQVFGFEMSPAEINRAVRFEEQNPLSKPIFPLIDSKLTKENCAAVLIGAGIKLPEMYNIGYNNNNCIGCVK